MPFIVHQPNVPESYQRVLDLLRQRPHTDKEMAQALGLLPKTIRQYIYNLCNDYGYTIESNGVYRGCTYTLRE